MVPIPRAAALYTCIASNSRRGGEEEFDKREELSQIVCRLLFHKYKRKRYDYNAFKEAAWPSG